MIAAFACIRTLIVCKCSKIGICLESARNVKSQQLKCLFWKQKKVWIICKCVTVSDLSLHEMLKSYQRSCQRQPPTSFNICFVPPVICRPVLTEKCCWYLARFGHSLVSVSSFMLKDILVEFHETILDCLQEWDTEHESYKFCL